MSLHRPKGHDFHLLTTMEKIASDTQLDNQSAQRIAAFGFTTMLSTPRFGFDQAQVKQATEKFSALLKRASERREKILTLLRDARKTA
jgi:hypothetical protein